MTTYEKYLQWKSEQTSKAPSIKAFCEWLDKLNEPEMVKRDRFGKIAKVELGLACNMCIYKDEPYDSDSCNHCRYNTAHKEYYYAKPD